MMLLTLRLCLSKVKAFPGVFFVFVKIHEKVRKKIGTTVAFYRNRAAIRRGTYSRYNVILRPQAEESIRTRLQKILRFAQNDIRAGCKGFFASLTHARTPSNSEALTEPTAATQRLLGGVGGRLRGQPPLAVALRPSGMTGKGGTVCEPVTNGGIRSSRPTDHRSR